jgi:hypothetical protein
MVTKFKPLNYKNARNTTGVYKQKVVNNLSTINDKAMNGRFVVYKNRKPQIDNRKS